MRGGGKFHGDDDEIKAHCETVRHPEDQHDEDGIENEGRKGE